MLFGEKHSPGGMRMKFLKIFIALIMLFLPCLYYNPSGVVLLGYQVAQVMETSYTSLIIDLSNIGS
jgi:hypothetical protein